MSTSLSTPVERSTGTPVRRTIPHPRLWRAPSNCPDVAPGAPSEHVASPTFWISTAPLASDGELTLGQLSGPYVAADVLARFLRAEGRGVLFTGATADHSAAVEVRALRRGRSAAGVAEGFRAAIDADRRRAGIAFDRIVSSHGDRGYSRWLRTLVAWLHAQGMLAPLERPLPHCAPCARWLHGAHVTGGCPHPEVRMRRGRGRSTYSTSSARTPCAAMPWPARDWCRHARCSTGRGTAGSTGFSVPYGS
ncbi:class I tRNA ligase family protein [Streptomyces lasiicapitis]|uniref:Methionyl/Leucyl tRNA synthetase domain-containing protein n=1 Tax=Streptomyces lasiicapitis TaxID=1923961 RepID=A0ABQ2LPT6_9ACTN|nr:class I tRNA ligase family protein [Streptomyces lasiicapitis]GGO41443.1 hypothetical protein GCM10012286_21320 [Streptomyces lasiicapitis]